jgi:uncharacterized protein (DUF433 family)
VILKCRFLVRKLSLASVRFRAYNIRIMDKQDLLRRITSNPEVFGGKPIIRGHRLAVEHVLGMLKAGETYESLLEGYPWLEREDIEACLLFEAETAGKELRL